MEGDKTLQLAIHGCDVHHHQLSLLMVNWCLTFPSMAEARKGLGWPRMVSQKPRIAST